MPAQDPGLKAGAQATETTSTAVDGGSPALSGSSEQRGASSGAKQKLALFRNMHKAAG